MLVCKKCGSINIQVKGWVNANTNEYITDTGEIGEESNNWCEDCEEHVDFVEHKEFRRQDLISLLEFLFDNEPLCSNFMQAKISEEDVVEEYLKNEE